MLRNFEILEYTSNDWCSELLLKQSTYICEMKLTLHKCLSLSKDKFTIFTFFLEAILSRSIWEKQYFHILCRFNFFRYFVHRDFFNGLHDFYEIFQILFKDSVTFLSKTNLSFYWKIIYIRRKMYALDKSYCIFYKWISSIN